MRVAVATPGTGVFIQETALAYCERGLLETYYTSFVANLDVPCYQSLVNTRVGRQLARREIAPALLPYTSTRPLPELLRTLSSHLLSETVTDCVWERAEKSFDRWVASKLHAGIDVLHCYEHCSLVMMQRAKQLGIFIVYEQPSQHHSYLTPVINAQLAMFPQLANEVTQIQVGGKAPARNARRDAELSLADMVLCNSSFTRSTLLATGIAESRICVVPLGFPAPVAALRRPTEKLRFLYAGTSSLRKGVHLLLQTWRESLADRNDVELWLVGKFDLARSCLIDLPANVHLRDSIPRNELLAGFCDAEVLVLPTLADGFGMVISEAMSRGLCVMCAENSAGPDIITDGHDGILFRSGDIESLRATLLYWSGRREQLREIGLRAMTTAAGYQWSDYRKRLVTTVSQAREQAKNAD